MKTIKLYIKIVVVFAVIAFVIIGATIITHFVMQSIFTKDKENVKNIDKTLGQETVNIIKTTSMEYGICPELIETICFIDDKGTYTETEIRNICDKLITAINTYRVDDMGVILTVYHMNACDKESRKIKIYADNIPSYTNRVLKMSALLEEYHGK